MNDTTLQSDQHDIADHEAYIVGQTAHMREPDRSDCRRYLRANPGHSIREWKGKPASYLSGAAVDDKPWQSLKPAEVRQMATSRLARDLPHNISQAAARDPALVWNPLARKYRLRQPGDPRPV